MAHVYADRVKETSTTTGTGTFNLSGPTSGFRSFVSGIGTGNTTVYACVHQTLAEWEIGVGTVTDAATDTLSRTTILASSNSGSAVSFSAGTKDVFCTMAADRTVLKDASGNAVLGTPASGTLTNCTGLPVSTGVSGIGTGIATFLATPSSANLASALTDETGSGKAVFDTSPTITTPTIATIKSASATAPPTLANSSGTEYGTTCRAWVNFNGTGTVAINANFNVSSITDNGVGQYTVNFANSLPDANYAYALSTVAPDTSGVNTGIVLQGTNTTIANKTTTQMNIWIGLQTSNIFLDKVDVSVAIFR